MYEKINHDIQQEYYINNFSNNGQRFVAWYLRNIFGLDIMQAKDCMTDSANDKQIDAVYINDQEQTIYIIQGKYYSGEFIDAEPVREVFCAFGLMQDLASLQESANYKLKVNSDIDWSKSINEIDLQLCKKYNLSDDEMKYIAETIKPMA